jgi:hypothetical protein
MSAPSVSDQINLIHLRLSAAGNATCPSLRSSEITATILPVRVFEYETVVLSRAIRVIAFVDVRRDRRRGP